MDSRSPVRTVPMQAAQTLLQSSTLSQKKRVFRASFSARDRNYCTMPDFAHHNAFRVSPQLPDGTVLFFADRGVATRRLPRVWRGVRPGVGRGAGAVSKGRFFTIGFSSKLSSYPIYTTIRESILALSKHLKQRAWAEKMLTRATGGVVLRKDGHTRHGSERARDRDTEYEGFL